MWLAFSSFGHGLGAVPLNGGGRHRLLTRTTQDFSPSFLHASHDVVFHTVLPDGRTQIERVSTDGGEPAVVLRDARSPSASPVDNRILYLAGEKYAELMPMVLDPSTGQSSRLSPNLAPGTYPMLRFTPDARRAILLKNEPHHVEVDVSSGAIVRTLTIDAPAVSFVDGKTILSIRQWNGDLWMADEPFSD
jgi:hypothetical protein